MTKRPKRSLPLREFFVVLALVLIGGGVLSLALTPRINRDALQVSWSSMSSMFHRAEFSHRQQAEVHVRFRQGVAMMQAREYDHAFTAFHRVIALDPTLPEAHVNAGFALVELNRPAEALAFFDAALALRAEQVNAYYGMGLALQKLGDLRGAHAALFTYRHRANQKDEFSVRAEAMMAEIEPLIRPPQTVEKPANE